MNQYPRLPRGRGRIHVPMLIVAMAGGILIAAAVLGVVAFAWWLFNVLLAI